jgi:hypothetical protein
MSKSPDIANIAVFCDFENVALGVPTPAYDKFDIRKVLERLLLKGSIVVKKAYCDWARYKEFKPTMHEAAFELIEIPHTRMAGQKLGRHPHGGGRARPLLHQGPRGHVRHRQRRLRFLPAGQQAAREQQDGDRRRREELQLRPADRQLRRVHLLRRPGAREGIPPAGRAPPGSARRRPRQNRGGIRSAGGRTDHPPEGDEKAQAALGQVLETIEAIAAERGSDEKIWGSMIKQTLKRRQPGFSEQGAGYRSFNLLLEDMAARGMIKLEHDEKSGGVIVRRATAD